MIIDLRQLPEGPRRFEFRRESDWWRPEDNLDQVLGADTPFDVQIEVSKVGEKFILKGSLSGGLLLTCDRCLSTYHKDLRCAFKLFMALPREEGEQREVELEEEDMEVDFIQAEEVDLDEIIREQIYLCLPMKFLCTADCLGLCPGCGRNLNEGPCRCEPQGGHPAFQKLKNLKPKGD